MAVAKFIDRDGNVQALVLSQAERESAEPVSSP